MSKYKFHKLEFEYMGIKVKAAGAQMIERIEVYDDESIHAVKPGRKKRYGSQTPPPQICRRKRDMIRSMKANIIREIEAAIAARLMTYKYHGMLSDKLKGHPHAETLWRIWRAHNKGDNTLYGKTCEYDAFMEDIELPELDDKYYL